MRRFLALLFALLLAALALASTPEAVAPDIARIHYFRPDGEYSGWELHVWEDTTDRVTWQDGLDITGESDYGVYWDVNLKDDARRVGFIVHTGDNKDPGPDMFLRLDEHGREIWLVSGSDTIHTSRPDLGAISVGDLGKAQAHWVARDLIAWNPGRLEPGVTFRLHYDRQAGLALHPEGVTGGATLELEVVEEGLPEAVLQKFPHLADFTALRLAETDVARVPEALKGQTAVSAMRADGTFMNATALQIPGVLDDLFTFDGDLGILWDGEVPMLRVWAPTAQSVRLHRFESSSGEAAEILDMTPLAGSAGVWTISGDPAWKGSFYLYEVTVYAPSTQRVETNLVTDPYSLSLALNSARSQIVNLADAAHMPDGWESVQKPPLDAFTDISIYELHVRDFSVHDPSVPDDLKGTYLAFTLPDTHGRQHLAGLANAGLTHLHLLPTFDIATINEDKTSWKQPEEDLLSLPSDSTQQQALLNPIRDEDPFNWGYDPYHYSVPEGSYATDPDGPARILEYRKMVQALNEAGLRVVLDVVYNHTNAAGQAERSVLDRIVPGYYHRLDQNGFVTTSTCCPNTATEHAMMEKLMIDSLLVWARDYKIDAFRFDLMGHHMVDNMQNALSALRSLTLEQDGVDGSSIYVYGEGWNFGEVANNARGLNATQLNVGGLGIGTFNDRLRDAVRGGGPFDNGQDLFRRQGFINGLYYAPNEQVRAPQEAQLETLLRAADQIRVGLAGNLADYAFEGMTGETITGAEVDYNGSPAGYTLSPAENIVYVSKHDNQTLWDIIQYKAPARTSVDDRVRMQNLGLSIVALSQGVPFFHAGSDMLRSKSLDRDSYNSGDHFNQLDFTYQTNNWGVGLPPAWSNEENWLLMRPLLARTALRPDQEQILASVHHLQEMLKIRNSSRLFRLESADDVMQRLTFHNTGPEQVPGVIVMTLSDIGFENTLDPEHDSILVVFNATGELQRLQVGEFAGRGFRLHPVQRASDDWLVRFSRFRPESGTIIVPARTTSVFVEPAR